MNPLSIITARLCPRVSDADADTIIRAARADYLSALNTAVDIPAALARIYATAGRPADPWDALAAAVQRRQRAETAGLGPDAGAEAEYASELVALAARDLVRYLDSSPNQPVGWGDAASRDPRPPRPPVVCLCGSTRFVDEFNRQRKELTEDGQIVLSIEVVTTQAASADPQHVNPALKARLDELHKRKIDLADYVLVLNVGGYIGDSTRSEISYARALSTHVRYLEPPHQPGPDEWACDRCGAAYFGRFGGDDGLCAACQLPA